jgi:hypothetical protein
MHSMCSFIYCSHLMCPRHSASSYCKARSYSRWDSGKGYFALVTLWISSMRSTRSLGGPALLSKGDLIRLRRRSRTFCVELSDCSNKWPVSSSPWIPESLAWFLLIFLSSMPVYLLAPCASCVVPSLVLGDLIMMSSSIFIFLPCLILF